MTTTDRELLGRVDALRQVLEAIHGTPLLFTGEPGGPQAPTVVRGRVDTDEVAGYVAAVRAERPTGTVEGYVRAKRVEQGGAEVVDALGPDAVTILHTAIRRALSCTSPDGAAPETVDGLRLATR
ncbi:hypothetical protein ACH4XT_01465 [Streptomyces avidinii]|uniref:hypothetical protein n=1 Tax=Streptomyces avidinii TaxID=1895 RepID=UPI003789A74A